MHSNLTKIIRVQPGCSEDETDCISARNPMRQAIRIEIIKGECYSRSHTRGDLLTQHQFVEARSRTEIGTDRASTGKREAGQGSVEGDGIFAI